MTLLLPHGPAAPDDGPALHGAAPDAAYEAAAEAGLFGRFRTDGDYYEGAFLGFVLDVEAGAVRQVRHEGELILEHLTLGITDATVRDLGVVVVLENETTSLTLHDNRYGWISARGPAAEVRLRFPPGSEVESVPTGISADIANETVNLFYEGTGINNVSMDGAAVRIRPQDGVAAFTVTTQDGIFGHEPAPGDWLLVAHTPTGTIIDRIGRDRYTPTLDTARAGHMELDLPLLGPDEPSDVVHRIETVGIFPGPPGRVAVHDGNETNYRPANLSAVLTGERSVSLYNLSHQTDRISRVLIRQVIGFGGPLSFDHDIDAPDIHVVRTLNLTRDWAPSERMPMLQVETDEPVIGILRLSATGQENIITNDTFGTRTGFRLDRLQPATHYEWTLLVEDIAGNKNQTSGRLDTPLDPTRLVPVVTILRPKQGTDIDPGDPVTAEVRITDGAGRLLPPDHITVRLDDRIITSRSWNDTLLTLRLGILEDGRHELEVRATGYVPQRVTTERVVFTVAAEETTPAVPAAGIMVALVLLLYALRPHRGTRPTD